MIDFLRSLIRPKYEPLNKIQIIKQNLLDNFSQLQNCQPEAEIFPVLKSNAYGHGLKEVCQILNETPAKMVVVDSFPELQIVYKNFRGKVLVLSEMPLKAYRYCQFNKTEFCVFNLATVEYLARHHQGAKIHLFLNTGMNREGIGDLEKFLESAKDFLARLEVVGVCSHLASRDEESRLNDSQEEKFFFSLDILHRHKIFPKWVHLGNSAGIFTLRDKRLTAFRAGISLYGYNVFSPTSRFYESASRLLPALRLSSTVIGIQRLKAQETVSYNETYKSDSPRKIALVPFGYYEGLDRRLSNEQEFLIFGPKVFWAKIAGRVCMNLVCLDAQQNNFQIGDRVEIISPDHAFNNSVKLMAARMRTIPYEVLAKLQGNIHREII